MRIILASKSPRRREILEMLGLKFEIIVSEADESSDVTDPTALVRELAARKGRAVLDSLIADGEDVSDVLIISSDTLVFCDGEILGKPRDRADGERMLRLMSGRSHTVASGVAAIYGGVCAVDSDETQVRFSKMSDGEIDFYLNTNEYADKAGAYAVQGVAALYIDGIDGDYFNVVGLPLRRLKLLLRDAFGIDIESLAAN